MTGTPEYSSWMAMKSRCYDPNATGHKNYGGRCITVCDRWLGSEGMAAFWKDMGKRPSLSHSIDRIDNDGNYEPSNCRWATPMEQSGNRRNNRVLTYDGRSMTVANWARHLDVPHARLYKRLQAGWSTERTLTSNRYPGPALSRTSRP